MLDRLSVPRRALDFEDYIDIIRRNFRWLIGPAFAGLTHADLGYTGRVLGLSNERSAESQSADLGVM